MSVVAVAVVGSAVAGAAASRKASKDQVKGIEKGIDASAALAQQAREDVNRLFQQGAAQGRAGLTGAFNFYRQAAPQRMAPVTQGFQQGINALGQGAQQANNAILGLPVDMSFTNQQVQQAPAGYLDAAALPQAPMQDVNSLLGEVPGPQQNPSISQQSGGKWNMLLGSATNKAATGAAAKFQNQRPYTTAVMGR